MARKPEVLKINWNEGENHAFAARVGGGDGWAIVKARLLENVSGSTGDLEQTALVTPLSATLNVIGGDGKLLPIPPGGTVVHKDKFWKDVKFGGVDEFPIGRHMSSEVLD